MVPVNSPHWLVGYLCVWCQAASGVVFMYTVSDYWCWLDISYNSYFSLISFYFLFSCLSWINTKMNPCLTKESQFTKFSHNSLFKLKNTWHFLALIWVGRMTPVEPWLLKASQEDLSLWLEPFTSREKDNKEEMKQTDQC